MVEALLLLPRPVGSFAALPPRPVSLLVRAPPSSPFSSALQFLPRLATFPHLARLGPEHCGSGRRHFGTETGCGGGKSGKRGLFKVPRSSSRDRERAPQAGDTWRKVTRWSVPAPEPGVPCGRRGRGRSALAARGARGGVREPRAGRCGGPGAGVAARPGGGGAGAVPRRALPPPRALGPGGQSVRSGPPPGCRAPWV